MASSSSGSSATDNSPNASAAVSTASTASTNPTTHDDQHPTEETPNDTSKLRMFLGILKKFIGVADIAAVRFSLPSQLLEPTPNLEYWNYLDRPETFVSIGTSDDELERMLEVLRFWFTKDLKYVKGKPCKPYNSTLGEFFRCNWDIDEALPAISAKPSDSGLAPASSKNTPTISRGTSSANVNKLEKPVRVSYLTEQTSHHPPVSAFWVDCPEKGISAHGFDQISAKFTGTSIKVTPGEHNLGIFITLANRDNEQYQLTHPAAHLGGLLRGSLSVTVGDQCYITCPKTRMKTILHYVEEGWIGKAQNKVEGVIFRYDPENDNIIRIRDVPEKDIIARISGNWRERLYFSVGPKISAPKTLLIDVTPLEVVRKKLPPPEKQLSNESLRFWSGVTNAILAKQYNRATTIKQELEEGQREKARQRQNAGVEWTPRFFVGATSPLGRPELTDEGREALSKLQKEDWDLAESEVKGA